MSRAYNIMCIMTISKITVTTMSISIGIIVCVTAFTTLNTSEIGYRVGINFYLTTSTTFCIPMASMREVFIGFISTCGTTDNFSCGVINNFVGVDSKTATICCASVLYLGVNWHQCHLYQKLYLDCGHSLHKNVSKRAR
jgi:hypothetical protein